MDQGKSVAPSYLMLTSYVSNNKGLTLLISPRVQTYIWQSSSSSRQNCFRKRLVYPAKVIMLRVIEMTSLAPII